MALERTAAFEALVHRASTLLLKGESGHDDEAVAEAMLLVEFLRRRYADPFTPAEVAMLVDGDVEDRRATRALLDYLRTGRAMPAAQPLVAAE